MRWHVHGTDVTTGQRMTLAVEEREASHAVQAALSKRIIVSHVTRARLRSVLFPLACAAAVVFVGLSGWLYGHERAAQVRWREAVTEQSRLAESLLEMEGLVRTLQKQVGEAGVSTGTTKVAGREAGLEKKLAELQRELAAAGELRGRLEGAMRELQDSREAVQQLGARLQQRSGEVAAAQSAAGSLRDRAAVLEQQDAELRGEVELLKSQLLVAAAKSTVLPEAREAEKGESGRVGRRARWSLRAGYEAASNFVAMHFDKETMRTEPTGEGAFAWTAVSSANAATVRIVHDQEKQRVYSATLTVSLAADGPRQKLEENVQLVKAYVGSLVPGSGDMDGRIGRAIQQLADKDAGERTVLVVGDAKISVWNNHLGVYTWRVESLGNELAE